MIDLTSACQRTSDVLMHVTDEQLNGRTPCEKLSLRDLVAHVGGLALAFTAAAGKEFGELTDTPPVDGVPLDDGLARPSIRRGSRSWRGRGENRRRGRACPEPAGSTSPARWRDRRAGRGGHPRLGRRGRHRAGTTTSTRPPDAALPARHRDRRRRSGTRGMFGPAVPVADDAPTLDRIVALSGRDPAWRAP